MKRSTTTPIITTLFSIMLLMPVISPAVFAQQDEPVGKLIYFEGTVQINDGDAWENVSLDQQIFKNQFIKTGPDGSAEIQWNTGVKSLVGPSSNQEIAALYNQVGTALKSQSSSLWGEFKSLFSENTEAETQEEGGIRRNKATVEKAPGMNELYWRKMKEVKFKDASTLYQNEKYREAAIAFEGFLEQKPNDPRAKMSMFALGHCYVELNNLDKANKVFRTFVNRYPEDEMAKKAESFITQTASGSGSN